jgi:hypothetical protein
MNIKINRTTTEPPPRDYSKRDTIKAQEERLAAFNALASLHVGNSIEFTGEDVTRDRVNSLLSALPRRGHMANFATANIPGGIGVWRTN